MLENTTKNFYRISACSTHSSFLKRLRTGNEEAWKQFQTRYVKMIRAVGKSRGLSDTECEDLMAEVMIVFWKKVEDFIYDPAKGKFRSYLGKIAEILSMKTLRLNRKKLTRILPEEYPDDIDILYMEQWKFFLIDNALEELKNSVDTTTFQAFYMLVFQNRSVKEVSAVTRKSPNTIYNIRSRCTRKLKLLVDKYRQSEEMAIFSKSHSHKNE